jgi:hypothetical protein
MMRWRRAFRLVGSVVETLAPDYADIVRGHYYKHGALRLFLFPRTFNELIQHKKIFNRDPMVALTADKYRVRQYVKERIGERYLVPLLAVVTDPQLIDFTQLPQSFVVKANHGAGFNFFVDDKDLVDRAIMNETVAAWLHVDFAAMYQEWAYRSIERRIVIEERLASGAAVPADYKFFVFRGRVRLIQLDQGRYSIHRQNLYDEHWRPLAVEYVSPRSSEPDRVPPELGEMIELAQSLAAPFEFARIDLYLVAGRIFFGEITHYPNAGLVAFKPPEFDRVLGDVWRSGASIPNRYYLND